MNTECLMAALAPTCVAH